MFTALGFSGTSMDELADAACVSKATIYNHFGSKECVFETVLRDLVRQLPAPLDLVGRTHGRLPERLTTVAHAARGLATSPLMHDIQRMLALPMDGAGRSKGSFWHECLGAVPARVLRPAARGDRRRHAGDRRHRSGQLAVLQPRRQRTVHPHADG